jgi:hypothetical protein
MTLLNAYASHTVYSLVFIPYTPQSKIVELSYFSFTESFLPHFPFPTHPCMYAYLISHDVTTNINELPVDQIPYNTDRPSMMIEPLGARILTPGDENRMAAPASIVHEIEIRLNGA